jgi:translation initiation factor 4G
MIPAVIRQARWDDARFLAWVILAATRSHLPRGWFDIALSRSEAECLRFIELLTTTSALSYWHYSRFLIVDDAGPQAALCAFRARDAYSATTAALVETMQTLGMTPPEVESVWRRGSYMFSCTIRPEDDSWMIENVATLPTSRGRGYTAALVDRALDIGREAGATLAQTSMFIGNDAAERTFRRAGFHLAQERRNPDFEATAGAPGIHQLARALAPR